MFDHTGNVRRRRRSPTAPASGAAACRIAIANAAAAFAIGEFDIATIPSLPGRTVAESMLGQAAVGLPRLGIDVAGMLEITDRNAPGTATDDLATAALLDTDAFGGFRAFLDLAGKIRLDGAPVKWQFVGPVTLGVALERAGLDRKAAFDLAQRPSFARR